MSSQGWRKNSAVIERLTASVCEFSFVQAIRLLERMQHYSELPLAAGPLGEFAPPGGEVVRIAVKQSLSFPAGELDRLDLVDISGGRKQWRLLINLIGLTGSMGVLPYHYTEMILSRQRYKDRNIAHFFNLFNHRVASLLYKAETRYKLPLKYERNRLFPTQVKQHSDPTGMLLSIIGIGSAGLQNRLCVSDEALLCYSGLLSQKIRTAGNLRQIIRSYFDIPVEITEFVGQWCEMIPDVRTRLASFDNPKGCNACLGRNALLGKNGWFSQGKIQIVLGPLNKNQLTGFAPGTSSLKALNELVRFYLGMENEYEFIVRARKRDLPQKTRMSRNNPAIMGWNTFLHSKPVAGVNAEDTVDISFSSSRMQ